MIDTIAAIATPEGKGGVSVIRISGDKSFRAGLMVYIPHRKPFKIVPWRVTSGHVQHPSTGLLIDEVLVVFFKGPRSYTGEDVVELSCHGNPFVTHAVLEAVLATGIRLAEPGEFTRRAFENGRIDLSKAEAVAMMTISESEAARRAALTMLEGGLAKPVKKVRQVITELRVAFELDLDFPEEKASVPHEKVIQHFADAGNILRNLIESGDLGDQLRHGRNIVISGKVNAGKSSLFNQLTGRDRAIVSEEAGTTRDSLEASTDWNGCRVTLFDTAGIRQSSSTAEIEAIRRSRSALEIADLVIYVVDGADPDLELIDTIDQHTNRAPVLVFWNKTDISGPLNEERERIKSQSSVIGFFLGSARKGDGVQDLRSAIVSFINNTFDLYPEIYLMMTLRQRDALQRSILLLDEAGTLYKSEIGSECIVPLMSAIDHQLGTILGDTVSPDILANIFSGFCIGK